MSVQNPVVPMGTAVGSGWQYRIERAGHYSLWRNWAPDLAFVEDPEGGDLRLNTTYWLYGRNANLPAFTPGSLESELAASFQINDNGQMVPVSATGKVDDLKGSSSSSSSAGSGFLNLDQAQVGQLFTTQLINNKIYAAPISRVQLLTELLTLIGQTSSLKTLLCELVASCDLPASDTYEWIIDEQYEEVIDEVVVPTGLTILIDSSDFAPSGTGIFRIAGPATLVEGAAGQYRVEEQLTTGSWVSSSASVVWSTVGAPSGVSIQSASGLLIVGANTLSADVSISVHAALLNSVVELPVTLSNTAPAITGYHMSGPATLAEGATSAAYSVIIDYADGSSLVYVGAGAFSLVGAPSGVSINGGSNAQCSITAALNSVSTNTDIMLRFTLPNSTQINKTVTIQDLPCTSHTMLTQSQYDALPTVFIWEYLDTATPNGPLSYTVRPFISRAEAISNVPLFYDNEGFVNFDQLRATTSNCSVGDVLYGDDRTEHIQANTYMFYPVEAGYWGFNFNPPANSQPGSFVLLQTNACGEITSRELITIPAGLTNYALASLGATATASSTYPDYGLTASRAIDGNASDFTIPYWNSAAIMGSVNEYLDIDLGVSRQLNAAVLIMVPDNYLGRTQPVSDSETFTLYGLTAFRIQAWSGSSWATIATVTGNDKVKKRVSFNPVTTTKIRIQVDGIVPSDTYVRIMEVQLFGPQS